MVSRIITLILLLISSTSWASGLFANSSQPKFLPANQAFAFSYQQQGDILNLYWQVSPDYYLYRNQLEISASDASLAPVQLPAGEIYNDEFFGDTEIYRNQLQLSITINRAQQGAVISLTYQGCAAAGFCYPPQTKEIMLDEVIATTDNVGVATTTSINTTVTGQLPFNPLWALLIGIGIAFTPCVLPMYPLISSIVLGSKQRMSNGRTLWLSLVYVQGMALTYTLLGLIVAMAGLQFQTALQSPWVLITMSMVFALLALSMFGLFTLQLPSSLQTRLSLLSNQQKSGATLGVFSMGAIGGLICSPCTTAPLSAILLYIAQSGNLWQGGGTLYLYALGMGLPLILITVFGNRLLPKSGPWMSHVKTAFGFIILALPIFLLERIVGEVIGLLLWASLGLAFFAWAFITSLQGNSRWIRLVQIIFLAAALVAVRPLQDWLFTNNTINLAKQPHGLNFTQIHNIDQLSQALANTEGKPVMLDLYADWCTTCKEFEKYTFSDSQVQQALKNSVLLQIDMTRNSTENNVLYQELNVYGLPAILFFNGAGDELTKQRVTGFLNADKFLTHLQELSK